MKVYGICKARNEEHILQDTLDNWAQWCDGGIFIYLDVCTDRTAEIAKAHPAVAEVVESTLYDPDRERAEWYCRQVVLHSAQRFATDEDWIAYFDADEHLERFDLQVLARPDISMVAVKAFDTYITPEDAHLEAEDYRLRRWVSKEYQYLPTFYRNSLPLKFWKPDQRNLDLPSQTPSMLHGLERHWGKAISVKKWDEKCQYYGEIFGPKYAAKWKARYGQAVKTDMKSDFGYGLVLWDDVLQGKVRPICRNGKPTIR